MAAAQLLSGGRDISHVQNNLLNTEWCLKTEAEMKCAFTSPKAESALGVRLNTFRAEMSCEWGHHPANELLSVMNWQ